MHVFQVILEMDIYNIQKRKVCGWNNEIIHITVLCFGIQIVPFFHSLNLDLNYVFCVGPTFQFSFFVFDNYTEQKHVYPNSYSFQPK